MAKIESMTLLHFHYFPMRRTYHVISAKIYFDHMNKEKCRRMHGLKYFYYICSAKAGDRAPLLHLFGIRAYIFTLNKIYSNEKV